MRRFFIIVTVLLGGLLVFSGLHGAYAQAVVEGRIIDIETKEPLQGAHVFFSGTAIGTSTGPDGRYVLRKIPPGAHRLVVSIIGYGRKKYDLMLGPEEQKTMDFGLKPVVYEMNEVFVGDPDKKWEKRFRRFEDLFLGKTKKADSITILNPEVLRFDSNFWGRLTAEALAPLKIENRALGYQITYYLDEFEHTGTRTRWDGDPVFTEMTSSDSLRQSRWEENRREAFYGSLRHFLLALIHGRTEEEGFVLYRVRETIYDSFSENRFRVSPNRLIGEGKEPFLFKMKFNGRLEVIYTREKVDPHYRQWAQDTGQSLPASQVSWLELNESHITIDTDGEIAEPYGATQMGYFAFERLADLTPREYRPEGYAARKGKLNK